MIFPSIDLDKNYANKKLYYSFVLLYHGAHLHEAIGKSSRAIDGRIAREATHLAERVRHAQCLAFAHGAVSVYVEDAEHESRALTRSPLAFSDGRARAKQQPQLPDHILKRSVNSE